MKAEFVPYKQALALKELGFNNENCFARWSTYPDGDGYLDISAKSAFQGRDDMNRQCLVPLYQQAFRWFREKYELVVDWNYSQHDNFGSYIGVCIKNIHLEETIVGVYKAYEEAELECLKKLIEIVKQK